MDPDSPLPTVESASHFSSARAQAFWQEAWALLTGKSIDLLGFEEVRQRLRLRDKRYLGLQEVPIDKIVGSVGRYKDFTRSFLPRTNAVRSRWQRLDAMARGMGGFPPIDLIKVGDAYFVEDGNHRVSVAKQLGAKTIEAFVTEMPTPVSFDANTKPDDLIRKQGYIDFLRDTHLDKLRPDSQVILTEPSRYQQVIEHISVHKYFMGIEQGRDPTWEEAAASWYDHVYMPMIELIRNHNILEYFPGRTEADLYAWLVRHQEALRLSLGGESPTPEEAVEDFVKKLETIGEIT